MRRLVHILVSLLVVGIVLNAVLAGCRGWSSDRRLVEADTLIAQGDFDSALTQLRTIDTASLSTDDRAYHALLMVHAAYKAYDSTYLDTTWIARARAAYADGGPYDRHIRTLLYSGSTADELGDPITAMRWYKLTELEAKKDDHYHRGFALMRMGFLYEGQANSSNLAISHFTRAKDVFNGQNNNKLLLTCLTELGACYRIQNKDSALYYITQATQLAANIGDSSAYYYNINDLAGLYYKDDDFQLCKTYARFVAENGAKFTDSACFYLCAISYAQLGDTDSARYFLERSRVPRTIADTLLRNQAESIIKTHRASHPKANDLMVDSLMRVSLKTELSQAETIPAIERMHSSNSNLVMMVALLSAALLLMTFCLIIYRKKKRRILINIIRQAEKAKEELLVQMENTSKEKSANSHTIILKKALQTIVQEFPKKQKKDAVKSLFTPAFLRQMYQCVDKKHNNLAQKLLASEKISVRDANVACMHFCGLPNFFIMCYLDMSSEHSVTTRKKIIAQKLLGEDANINQIPQAF